MASQILNAVIEGTDNLSKDLYNIAGAARTAASQLESVNDELNKVTVEAQPAAAAIGQAASATSTQAKAADEAEEQTKEMRGGLLSSIPVLGTFSGAAGGAAIATGAAADQMDEAADQADDMTTSFLKASGAAEALQLSSSALSINVGFMTVALRNATTQIPALVATLGTLGATLSAVAGAAVLAGVGVAGVVAAGLAAEVQSMTDDFEDLEEVMAAFKAIGLEILDMFMQAAEPLLEMKGAAGIFISFMETLAETANAFAEGIRRSYEAGEELYGLKDFMDEIGQAWDNNLTDIIAGFQTLFHYVGPFIAGALELAIEKFDEFATYVSEITLKVAALYDALGGRIGDFVKDFVELAITLGAGLIPILNLFFDVMSGVADIINEAGTEVIGFAIEAAGLMLILNRIAGITGTVIGLFSALPASMLAATRGVDTFAGAMLNMHKRTVGFINEFIGGFAKLGKSVNALMPTAESTVGIWQTFRNTAVSNTGALSRLSGAVLGLGASLKGMIFNVSAASISLSGFADFVGRKVGVVANHLNRMQGIPMIFPALGGIRERILSVIPSLKALQLNFIGLSKWMVNSGGIAKRFGLAMQTLNASMVAGYSVTGALRNALAMLTLQKQSATWSTIALGVAQKIAAGATMLLTGAMGALAVTAGALFAAFSAIVIIGGAVAAALGTLGERGEDTKNIIEALRNGLIRIGDKVMPIFVASANMLLDVLDAIMAPMEVLGEELDVFGEGAGFVDTLVQSAGKLSDVMEPLLLRIGDVAQAVGERLAKGVRSAMPLIRSMISLFITLKDVFVGIVTTALDIITFFAKLIDFSGGFNVLMGVFTVIANVLSWIVGLITNVISGIANGISIAGDKIMSFLNKFAEGFNALAKAVPGLEPIEAGGGTAPSPGDQRIQRGDIFSGGAIARDVAGRAAESVTPGAAPADITYDEGDVNNTYNQEISADPEDKAQIGRIAKDAMEEANSFTRRQQGGQ